MVTCSISGCESQNHARGWCTKHYQRWKKSGDPESAKAPHNSRNDACSVEHCTGPVKARNLCSAHYWRWRNGRPFHEVARRKEPTPCEVNDCGNVSVSRGYCHKHYRRLRLYGDPLHIPPRNPRPRQSGPGRRWQTRQGYVYVYWPDHPNAHADGKVSEHQVVMSEHLERPLESFENVHHKNGVRDDNRIENLELWIVSQPAGRRVSDAIRYANSVLALYGGDPESF